MTHKLDLLITNGRILDGTGNPGYEADIGIVGAEIARMGRRISKRHAERVIDAGDKCGTAGRPWHGSNRRPRF